MRRTRGDAAASPGRRECNGRHWRSPPHQPVLRTRPVSGLTRWRRISSDAGRKRLPTCMMQAVTVAARDGDGQRRFPIWRDYRCGGSTGLSPVSRAPGSRRAVILLGPPGEVKCRSRWARSALCVGLIRFMQDQLDTSIRRASLGGGVAFQRMRVGIAHGA